MGLAAVAKYSLEYCEVFPNSLQQPPTPPDLIYKCPLAAKNFLLLDMSMFDPAIFSSPMCFNPHVNYKYIPLAARTFLVLDMSMFYPAIFSTPKCFKRHVNSMLLGMSMNQPAIFSTPCDSIPM